MGELTERDEDIIRVPDAILNNSDRKNLGTLLWKTLGQVNIGKLSRMYSTGEKKDPTKI